MSAPVTYLPGFVPGDVAASMLEHLWADLPWEQREGTPRRECWFNPYGQDYTYGRGEHARTYQAHHWDELQVSKFIGVTMNYLNYDQGSSYDCCFVNGYAHGRQHLGWHSDDSPEMDQDHPIATVSLGATREIWFRRRTEWQEPLNRLAAPVWGVTETLTLEPGSAAIMHAGMQREWQHRIPKSPLGDDCGRRISLTFRKLVR